MSSSIAKYTLPVLFLCLTLVQVTSAKGEYLQQSTHNRTLIFEGWRGSYLKSFYSEDQDSVRFDICGVDARVDCRKLTEVITTENLALHQNRMVETIRDFRKEVASDVAANPISIFLGGAENNEDVKALDQILTEIQTQGLRNWVKVSDENLRAESPALGSPEVMDELVARMKKTLEEPVERFVLPELGPADLRPQQ